MPQESCKCIDREFVDLVMYAVYRAANELLGERAWDLVWRFRRNPLREAGEAT
ncbi:MAG: hypothetical protein QXK66_00990 [Sulfolobales archaeon]